MKGEISYYIDGEIKEIYLFHSPKKRREWMEQIKLLVGIDNYYRLSFVVTHHFKYEGVSYNEQRGKWQAYKHVNAIKKCLGYYPTEEEAYEAYIEFITKLICEKFKAKDND